MASGRTARTWRDGEFVNRDAATIHVMRRAACYDARAGAGIGRLATPAVPAIFRRTTGVYAHSRQHAHVACLAAPLFMPRSRPSAHGGSSRLSSGGVS